MKDQWVCIVVRNGKVDNVQIGDELHCHNHAKSIAKSYSEQERQEISQIIVFHQRIDGTIENAGEYQGLKR